MRGRLRVDVVTICNEGEGDPRRFGLAGGVDEDLKSDAGIGRSARVLPRVHMTARPLEHDAERNVFLSHRIYPFAKYQAASESCSLARRSTEAKRSAAPRAGVSTMNSATPYRL
jgi:hypothetical protein